MLHKAALISKYQLWSHGLVVVLKKGYVWNICQIENWIRARRSNICTWSDAPSVFKLKCDLERVEDSSSGGFTHSSSHKENSISRWPVCGLHSRWFPQKTKITPRQFVFHFCIERAFFCFLLGYGFWKIHLRWENRKNALFGVCGICDLFFSAISLLYNEKYEEWPSENRPSNNWAHSFPHFLKSKETILYSIVVFSAIIFKKWLVLPEQFRNLESSQYISMVQWKMISSIKEKRGRCGLRSFEHCGAAKLQVVSWRGSTTICVVCLNAFRRHIRFKDVSPLDFYKWQRITVIKRKINHLL